MPVRIGVEAAGHYHQPVLGYDWPSGWEIVEVNPTRVSEQRKIFGRRRIKTDAIDFEAITELYCWLARASRRSVAAMSAQS